MRVVIIYRPPTTSIQSFLDEFATYVNEIVVTRQDILIVGDLLVTSKTCSLDSCPTDLLKKTVRVHIPYLVAIVNNTFKQGLFPITLRTAIVKPLLKSDTLDKDMLKNYRPVSNIAFVSKVLEKVAVCRLLDLKWAA